MYTGRSAHRYEYFQQSAEESAKWPPLVSIYQALWRMEPGLYFSGIPFFPLRFMPVLLLCADCAHIVADTHVEIELGEEHHHDLSGLRQAEHR